MSDENGRQLVSKMLTISLPAPPIAFQRSVTLGGWLVITAQASQWVACQPVNESCLKVNESGC